MVFYYSESGKDSFGSGTLSDVEVGANNKLQLRTDRTIYRRPIFLDHQAGIFPKKDYPVSLTIDYPSIIAEGKMQSDLSDVRFYTSLKTKKEYTVYGVEIPLEFTNLNTTYATVYFDPMDSNIDSKMIYDGRDVRFYSINTNDPYSDLPAKIPFVIKQRSDEFLEVVLQITPDANRQRTVYMFYGNPFADFVEVDNPELFVPTDEGVFSGGLIPFVKTEVNDLTNYNIEDTTEIIDNWTHFDEHLWIKVPQIGEKNINVIFLEYGDHTRSIVYRSPELFFTFFDDFTIPELNLNQWNINNVPYGIQNSEITLTGNTENNTGLLNSVLSPSTPRTQSFIKVNCSQFNDLEYGAVQIGPRNYPFTSMSIEGTSFEAIIKRTQTSTVVYNGQKLVDSIINEADIGTQPFNFYVMWWGSGPFTPVSIDYLGTTDYQIPDPIVTLGDEIAYPIYEVEGNRESLPIDISVQDLYKTSNINWDAETPDLTEIIIETNLSLDGGVTWRGWKKAKNGGEIPDLNTNRKLSQATLKVRETLRSYDNSITPTIKSLTIEMETTTRTVPVTDKDYGLGALQDVVMYSPSGYNEFTESDSADIHLNKNKYALWNGVEGEIKTKKGECQGVGMEEFGCDIWKILGQNLTELTVEAAKLYVKEIASRYEEIADMEVIAVVQRRDGKLALTIRVQPTFGDEMKGDVIIG